MKSLAVTRYWLYRPFCRQSLEGGLVNISRVVRASFVIAAVFSLLSIAMRASGSGSAELISIQELGELCPPEAMTPDVTSVSNDGTNLFAAFRETSVQASAQETAN